MDKSTKARIVAILDGADDMTIATLRADGYPQATTVSFVNDGLDIYFGCGENSQKAQNIARDPRVSLTVNLPYANWKQIRGVSLGGTAARVRDGKQVERVGQLLLQKFPQAAEFATSGMAGMALVKVTPQIVSILDYTQGFGHTELVTV
jgi:PPOX class probable F420-dependent enzyme